MLERFGFRIQLALVALMALAGAWARLQLPDGALVPMHFNLHGEVDGWASPGVGLFAMPLTALVLLATQWLLPRIDPRGDNLRRSGKAVASIFIGVTVVLAVVQAQIIATALGLVGVMPKLPLLLMGGLFVVMGNVLGKLRTNFTVGIRTPWTLSNERVWDQTHRFGGKVFVGGGLLLLVLALSPLPAQWQGAAIAGTAIAAALASVFKSWWLWRRLQGQG